MNTEKNIRLGDIVCFKGRGLTFTILSGILSIFDAEWRNRKWKPWHVGFISREDNGWMVCEAMAGGVGENPLNDRECRVYHWFDEPLPQFKVNRFVVKHLGEKYDVLVYFFTAAAYLIRHYWGRPIPRLMDNSWSCWELVYYFCNRMGKPLAESYDFPLISDLVKVLSHPD